MWTSSRPGTSGSPTHDISGKEFVRLGGTVSCPQFYLGSAPHGVNKIITAHETLTALGIPVAVHGCKPKCGCTLIGKANASVD
ncbi:MAG: PAAR domain-containing protein [Sphingomonadaceae bacterium]